jgi:FXSXX-COOH protein
MEGKESDGCTTHGQGEHMHEDVDQFDGGRIDLSRTPLRDLTDLTGSALDRALVNLLEREDADEKSAGFQNRI